MIKIGSALIKSIVATIRLILRRRWSILLIGALLIMLASDDLDPGTLYNKVTALSRDVLFDYTQWEVQASAEVIGAQFSGTLAAMSDDQRSAYVVGYLASVRHLQDLQGQVARVYSDPNVNDPKTAAANLITQLQVAQSKVNGQTPLAEAIIDSQVSAVLASEGFTWLDQVWPPVAAKFTDMPDFLVISPRNAIHFDLGMTVNPLSADQADALEHKVDRALNVSSLVVPLGGLSLYPSMVAQTWYAPALFADVAHEWSHLYMALYPLGWNYDQPETRIIDESTALRFGTEIGRETIERYYQKYLAILNELPPLAPTNQAVGSTPAPTKISAPDDMQMQSQVFDYGSELNQVRITADYYLWLGRVDQAETYMNDMRDAFIGHHYAMRKLNQAFFAFYGGYQSGSAAGAGGTDPTGDAIAALRDRAPSILAWINQMRWITTKAELLKAAG